MTDEQIREYAESRRFHPQTLARWLGWDEADRDALFRIAYGLKVGENHLRDLLDWLEEIAGRDGSAVRDVLASRGIIETETDPRLGRADKLKRIKEQIRRLRFPRLARTEDAIRERIQELKLQPEIRLSVAPGLEGGALQVAFQSSDAAEFERLAGKLLQAADKDAVKEIFRLLSGEAASAEAKADV
jgi:hypothetical protein